MIVYDTANKLAKELKECEEYVKFKKAKEEITKNPELKEKIEHFEKMRNEMQMLTLQGGTPVEEKATQIQNEYAELLKNDTIKEYFDAEFKFSIILADVNKIIAETIREVMQ